ncbi:MAG TPA: class IV adenylate cyclase [bacterium]|nr:class IV adenylate cyclase [bacterium]HQG46245.1 class IV adenylate cyclase [bacterium]HQJ65930.1 class IV adenylate cyclase [bacterium]
MEEVPLRNIEIKARIESIELMAPRVAVLADKEPVELDQDDTFFRCPAGRLKLRAWPAGDGVLIYYQRPDCSGPKESFYVLADTHEPDALREVLTHAYGQIGRVRKHRTLFWRGRTRIHLDHVEGLGTFLELEVMLEEGEPAEVGEEVARELMERLGIAPEQLIEVAYLDLLEAKSTPGGE